MLNCFRRKRFFWKELAEEEMFLKLLHVEGHWRLTSSWFIFNLDLSVEVTVTRRLASSFSQRLFDFGQLCQFCRIHCVNCAEGTVHPQAQGRAPRWCHRPSLWPSNQARSYSGHVCQGLSG